MAGRGIVIKIEGDGESARQALLMVQQQMRETRERAEEAASGMESAFERVKGALETVGIYMGVREAIEGIRELAGESLELGETLEQASKKTGMSVESLSVLHYAASITGNDFNGLTTAVGRMDSTIGKAADGNAKAAAFLKGLGLNAQQLAHSTDGSEVAFHKFLTTLAATEAPAERANLAMGLLGRSGVEQIPMLLQLANNWDFFKQKAQEAGVMLNGDTAAQLAATNQRLKDMEQHALGAGVALMEGLSPALSQVFSVISGGRSQMEQMQTWGQDIGKTIAFVAEVAYSAASALEFMFGAGELGKFTEAGRRDMEAAKELQQKAQEFHDIAFGNRSPSGTTPFIPHESGGGIGPGFEGAPTAKKGISQNPIAEAEAALQSEQARAAAAAQKNFDEQQLAELETQHKLLLVSDQEFYQEKLALQLASIDAEEQALDKRRAALQQLYTKQQGDKLAKRDSSGNSAEMLRTQRELLQIQEQMDALETQRGRANSTYTAESNTANQAANLANLRAAAELEKQRNDGITAQIALMRQELDLEVQRMTAQGASSQAIGDAKATEQRNEQALQMADVYRQIEQVLNDNTRAVKLLNDEAEKNPLLRGQITKQINQDNRDAAQQVQGLVTQYDQLAQALGGPALEAAKNLHLELAELNTPNEKGDSAFIKEMAQGVEKITNTIVENAALGTESWHKMVKSIEKDALELALKLAEQKFLTPLLEGQGGSGGGSTGGLGGLLGSLAVALAGGAGAEHHMSGGVGSGGPQWAGEAGPEIWTPPSSGGTYTPTSMLSNLAQSSAGRGVNITSNVINQTSNPVQSQPSQVSYDSELKSFIVTTILNDHGQNGPIAQSFGGMQNS